MVTHNRKNAEQTANDSSPLGLKTILGSQSRYNLSLYILVPFIFSGMSVLTGIIAFQLSKYLRDGKVSWEITILFMVIIMLTFLCGFLITWLLLKPMQNFVKEAKKMPIFDKAITEGKSHKINELERFNLVFQEVTNLLSKVEAKQLFPLIIGQSKVMRGLFSQILKIAPTESTCLIMGESGTGKELVATSIYEHSLRKNKPFIKLNCVAIPDGLLESELFGHEKGAFTGATARKIGKFEQADGGTILLDEIGDMPLETQAKLLRVLQEKEFERVGGTKTIKVDVRFIAASNRDLPSMVETGQFREDLYYRLNVFTLVLPPLSDRREDIPTLIEYFLEHGPKEARISSKALQILMNYSWPGNVRELRNTVERLAVMADNGIIEPANVPANILASGISAVTLEESPTEELAHVVTEDKGEERVSIDDQLRSLEKKMIIDALITTGGVQSKAAELLGIKERSLWHRIKKYEVNPQAYKARK